ncbi:MAG: tandem-95 repeat protein [Bacteroidetes bacterium]|nr:tandem-95 repeat protein [Bacteroidota bacterium]
MKGNFYALRRLFSSSTNLFPQFILIVVLFFSFTNVNAKTVVIGSGSGNVSQTSMSGLNPGDILAIAPGTYTGGNFSNLSGISIISQSTRVTFTGTVTFGSNTNVSFSGFTIMNTGGSGMTWPGTANGCTISNVSFTDIGGNAIDVSSGLAYTGSISSLKMYNCKFDSITVERAGYFLRGSYGQIGDKADFSDSVIMSRISIDQTKTNGEQVRGVFFRLYAHDWKVTYSGNNPTGGDVGIFTVFGNACFNNFWQSGGAGYIARVYNAAMVGTPRNTYLYNSVRINTTRYGFIDIRLDATNIVAGLTTGTNCYIYNNTAVNCSDDGGYIAPMVVLGLYGGYTCSIKNNLGINLKANSLAQEIIQNNSGGSWAVDTGGNRYYASTSGIIDGTTCRPVTGSPVIGAGITIPFITDDYYHTTITGAYDIGAVQTNGVAAAPNQSPIANAGANKTITLPTNSVALDGSASNDPDGSIASYSWAQISGPSTATITNGNTSKPTVGALQAGAYTFQLTVTDNKGATATAQVTVTVNNAAPNQPPVANAGTNQTITLPTSSASLNGTGSSDPDGTIASYAWSQVSGPGSTITNASAASTVVTGLTAGTYVFKLTVTDNSGATASANVTITVNPAVNVPPTANAGADQTITLPTSSVNVDGSASTDADGTIVSYSWTQKSGPSTATIANASSVNTNITGLVQGTYIFNLVVTDNGGATGKDSIIVTVKAAANQPPVANAGASKSITLPTNSVNLDGSASSDPDGTITSYSWAQITGPSASTITNGNTATPTASNLIAGLYTFELTVTDNSGATGKAQVKITVVPSGSTPPVANAGADQTITLPTNSVNLNGGGSQAPPSGSISSYAWTQNSGPTTATIGTPGSVTTTVSNLTQGVYVFKLVITDNLSATASDIVTITVLAAPNQSPIANAGASKTITLPTNSVGLSGAASSDPDGTIASYSWAQISGPSTSVITNGNTATPTVGSLIVGQYTFELTVTDNQGATAKAQVKVTVTSAPNQAPIANAGGDKAITLPTSSVSLDGSASSDPDGTIASYNWAKISGPGTVTISNGTTAKPTITGLQAGTYIFELTVTDNKGATAKDQVTVTVTSAAPPPNNQAPIANAGPDQTITLPSNAANLNGTASYDPDGSIASYSWAQISGPSTATLQSATTGTPSARNLVAGTYVIELTVTDNNGATAKDRVTITVKSAPPPVVGANVPPVANAGADQTITLPTNSVMLDGTGSTDQNGTITTFQWQETSGPNTATIASFNNATSEVSDLVIGEYTFQLTVTDNNGSNSTATVKVKVVDNLRSTESILVYPNPAHDVVNLRLISDTLGTVKVNIYDMNGKLVHASQMEKPANVVDQQINVSRLAGGMYTLQALIGTNKVMLSKLIKQ